MEISVPWNPSALGYDPNYIIYGAQLFNGDDAKARILLDIVEAVSGELIDDEEVEPTADEEAAINRALVPNIKKNITPKEADRLLKEISLTIEDKPVKERMKTARALARNPVFARLVKQRADYVCEICGAPGFTKVDGTRYAEAHHVDELAKSRIDNPSKMICICPVCHRVIHYGSDEALEARKALMH